MELSILGPVILSLSFVIFCLYAILRIFQKFTKFGAKRIGNPNSLKINDIVYVDNNTKIVLISQRNINYAIAIGKNNLILIDKYESEEKQL